MKRITSLAVILCLLGAALSCTHDEPSKSEKNENNVHEWEDSTLSGDAVMGSAMAFKVGGDMSVERTTQTRAATNINGIATFTEGDLVAVAVTRSGGSEVPKLYQVKSDGSLEYAGGDNDPFVWKSTGETVTIRAWSYGTSTNLPYTLTAPETRDYSLETDQQTNGYRELLYCKAANKSYSGGAISLDFYHQLTRVVFNVKHEKRAALTVNTVAVGNISFPKSARFSVPTGSDNVGTWAIQSMEGIITPKQESTQTNFDRTYSAVIFPQTYSKNTKMFTLSNNEGDYVYNISEATGANLTAGNQYNYSITVKDVVPMIPIRYLVGTHNMQTATTMASDDWPEHSAYFHWGSNITTMTTTMRKFHDGITIGGKYYHLPSVREWMSIIPPYYVIEELENEGGVGSRINFSANIFTQTGLGEIIEWGRMKDGTYSVPATKFYNEYATHTTDANYVKKSGNTITHKIGYAIRHKDIAGPSGYGKYTCAYRYTYYNVGDDACNNHPSLRIKVRYLGASSTTGLNDIIGDSYWNQSGVTYYEVVIPCNSRGEQGVYIDLPAGSYPQTNNTACGYYWTSTPYQDVGSIYFFHFRPQDIMGNATNPVSVPYGVRLFADTE